MRWISGSSFVVCCDFSNGCLKIEKESDVMRTIKVKFSMATNRVGSTVSDIVEIEVDHNLSFAMIEDIVEDRYTEWLSEHNNGGWTILNEIKKEVI